MNLDASVRHPAVQGHKLREVLPLFGHGQGEAEARPKSASADLKQAGRAKPVALLVMAPGTLADSLQRSIEQIGFGIRRADSEEAAFRELTSQDIDVVVVDGRLNGDDLARRLKREGLPVFVLTPDGAQTAAGEPQVPFHLWALRTADHSQA